MSAAWKLARLSGFALAFVLSGCATEEGSTAGKQDDVQLTAQDFITYYDKFSHNDWSYADMLADELTFPHPSGQTFHTKEEVLNYYKNNVEEGLNENRIPTFVVVDNENNRAAMELAFQFWTDEGQTHTFPDGKVIHSGEMWTSSSVLFYEFNDQGKITMIRGSTSGPAPIELDEDFDWSTLKN